MAQAITKKQIEQFREQNTPVHLIDIRTPEEYQKQHIPDAVNIPVQDLSNQLSKFRPADMIVCFCNHGRERSQGAAEIVSSAGFKNVYYLAGGVSGWLAEEKI